MPDTSLGFAIVQCGREGCDKWTSTQIAWPHEHGWCGDCQREEEAQDA